MLTNVLHGFIPVHDRHIQVEEHYVAFALIDFIHGILAVLVIHLDTQPEPSIPSCDPPQSTSNGWYSLRSRMQQPLYKVMREMEEKTEGDEERFFQKDMKFSSARRQLRAMQQVKHPRALNRTAPPRPNVPLPSLRAQAIPESASRAALDVSER